MVHSQFGVNVALGVIGALCLAVYLFRRKYRVVREGYPKIAWLLRAVTVLPLVWLTFEVIRYVWSERLGLAENFYFQIFILFLYFCWDVISLSLAQRATVTKPS